MEAPRSGNGREKPNTDSMDCTAHEQSINKRDASPSAGDIDNSCGNCRNSRIPNQIDTSVQRRLVQQKLGLLWNIY
jgi:hypothetical protein